MIQVRWRKTNVMYLCNLNKRANSENKLIQRISVFSRGVKLGEMSKGIKRHKLSVINKSQGYDTEHKEYGQ